MVPFRELAMLLFIESSASALSNTLLLNSALCDALIGVEGTVACTAGPSAALAGVIGKDICDAED